MVVHDNYIGGYIGDGGDCVQSTRRRHAGKLIVADGLKRIKVSKFDDFFILLTTYFIAIVAVMFFTYFQAGFHGNFLGSNAGLW